MENIQGMLEEIRGVVQNHFQDENKKITETISVLNNLPIVIALRKQVEELTKINTQLQEFLKMHDDRENIELEIVELEKNGSLEKKLIPDFFAEAAAASDGEQEDLDESSSEESEDLAIVTPYAISLANDIAAAGIAEDIAVPHEVLDVSGSNTGEA
jgi:hypothetical protein